MTKGYVNAVNKNHLYLIEEIFYPQKLEEIGNYTNENLLAKAIWYYLQSEGIKGFYYPLHEGNNDVVREKL